MKVVKIDKKEWTGGLESLTSSYRLFGPVADGNVHNFKELEKGEQPDLNLLNTRMSPKSITFPQSEAMMEYSLDESKENHHVMKEVDTDYSQRAVFGIRPCDAAAFLLVRPNFDNPEYKDPYWINLYEATTFVGLACSEPSSTCFCTTAGNGPFNEDGLDVLLVDAGDHYIAKSITAKGDALLKTAGWKAETDANKADTLIESMKKDAEEKITSSVSIDNIKKRTILEMYQAPFWEDFAFACINCGTCTYVCPTCWCFDIQDETHGNSGERFRCWDSCMFPLFTLHGSGHNPRGTKTHRVRQRFMHKLKYYLDKYDNGIQCVGCGRCIRLCPANIDIRRICNEMNSYEPAQ